MQVISLFSGVGGFELAASEMGWDVVVCCEINPFGKKVLKHYFPKSYHHDDVHTLTSDIINNEVQKRFGTRLGTEGTVLVGGFP